MSSYPVPRLFTPEEYLLLEREALRKSEYSHGLIYAMAGGGLVHNRIASNVLGHLYGCLRGTSCAANNSDQKVGVSREGPFYYPDVSISCGAASLLDAHADVLLDPFVIVEVLSKSTARYDRTMKLAEYQKIASVIDILLISQDNCRVEHYVRGSDGGWSMKVVGVLSEELVLSGAGGVGLPLSAVYERVEL